MMLEKNGLNGTNGQLSKKRQDTAQRIIKALHETQGLQTLAAKRAGVGLTTVTRYIAECPSVAQAVHEAKEGMVDFAEAKLYSAMKDGNMTAIIFYLKTQGKGRGYSERMEFTGEGGGPVQHEVDLKPKLIQMIERLANHDD